MEGRSNYNQPSCCIGVAVAVENGLVVPVLKFTDAMSLSQIGGSVRDLAGRAKNKNYYQPKWKEVLLPFLT
jgi:pyruvate/2-oxoglutarate dehydrogenase complex dihydrolipoamide acyltransferase (E2) component